MRLRWPFGRAERTEVAPPTPVDFDGSVRAAPSRRDWASLPPIQRTVADAPLVAPTTRFQADAVAGAHALPPILEPLGHEVDAAAPAGIVAAAPVVVPALTSSRPLVDGPAPRRAHAASTSAAAPDAVASGPSASAPPLDVPLDRQPASASQAAPVEPVRRLDIVPAGRPTAVPDRPLTRAAVPTAPVRPTVSRAASTGASPTHAPTAETSPLPPAGRPRMRTAERLPTTPPTPEPAVAARRAGLGAPLAVAPPTADPPGPARGPAAAPSLQRLAPFAQIAPGMPASPSAGRGDRPAHPALELPGRPRIRPVAQRTDLATGDPSRLAGLPDAAMDAPTSNEQGTSRGPGDRFGLAELPVVGPASGSPMTATKAALSAAATASVVHGVQRSTPSREGATAQGHDRRTSARDVRPIMGRRPLTPPSTDPVEAPSPAGVAGIGAGEPGSAPRGLPGSPGPVAQRAGALPPASFHDALDATAGIPSTPVWPSTAEPRMPGGIPTLAVPTRASADPATSAIGRTGGVQRTTSGPVPTPPPSAPALPLARPGSAPAASSASPAAEATTTRTVVFPGAARLGASSTPGLHVQRAADTVAPASGTPIGPTVTPAVQRVDGGSSTTPDEGTGEQSEEELQRLAGALYGRLRAQLRSELIHEREARGLTFDNP